MKTHIPIPLITTERNGSKVDCLLFPFFSYPSLSHVDKKEIRFYCLTNTGSKKKPGFKKGELIFFGDEEFDALFDCFEFFLEYQSSDQNSLIQVFAIEVPISLIDMSALRGFFA